MTLEIALPSLDRFQIGQVLYILLSLASAHFISSILLWFFSKKAFKSINFTLITKTVSALRPIFNFIVSFTLLVIGSFYFKKFFGSFEIIKVFMYLFSVWISAIYVLMVTRKSLYAYLTAILLTFCAGFHYLNILTPLVGYLDYYSIQLGKFRISIYLLIKALFVLILCYWGTSIVSVFLKGQLSRMKLLKQTTIELFSKGIDIILYGSLFFIILNVLGIDLTTFAVIGGALSVGIGFGLQKITSNFISGLILLVERTLEVGDLIEVEGGIAGNIRHFGSRAILLETFDGREIMVPNADFVTGRVVNWTYTHSRGRIEIQVGVAYNSDLKLVQELLVKAAEGHPKCVTTPGCFLVEFGDSSVNFDLYFFVNDVNEGRKGVKSEVLLRIWDLFKEHRISIPYPQRDVFIKNQVGS